MSHGDRFKDVTEPLPGFRDVVGVEVRTKRYIESALSELFSRWGYDEIEIPLVERASSFSEQVIGGSPWPEWDRRGVFHLQLQKYRDSYSDLPEQEPALLVPEGTVSVSRWLAKSLLSGNLILPKKIYYMMPCFRNELTSKLSSTKGRQFHQAGIEILGTDNIRADLEALLLAHSGFTRLGISNESILVRVGNVGLFNALCSQSGIEQNDILRLKDLLDTIAEARAGKDSERLAPSVEQVFAIVDGYGIPTPVRRKWELVTGTYTEQLDADFSEQFGFTNEVDALNILASSARELGINCVIDPSVVRSHEYYTGIVYEIDLQLPSGPVVVEAAGGGRYNKLIGKLLGSHPDSMTVPAVGFAYGIERVASVFDAIVDRERMDTQRQIVLSISESSADVVAWSGNENDHAPLFSTAEKLRRENGARVDVYVGDEGDFDKLESYAKSAGARLVEV